MPAEFDSERQDARKDMVKHRQIMGDKKAFKSTTTGVAFFDEHEHVAASKVLGWDETCIVKAPGALELMNPKERAVAKATTFKPWKPNNPIKEGGEGCVCRSLSLSLEVSSLSCELTCVTSSLVSAARSTSSLSSSQTRTT